MDDHSQFRLLSERRFLPFFLTQFSGAFNDNLFRNILLLLITYTAGGLLGLPIDVVVNIAALLFILPFFLFSGIAGQLADKYEKSRVIRWVKLAEIAIMALAAAGLWVGWYESLLLLLFLMGVQSTFFGPVKYAILPQVLRDDELVGGNALVEMGTFVAILVGTLAAGLLMGSDQPEKLAAIGGLALAVIGYLAARQVPVTGTTNPDMTIRLNPLRETWHLMRLAAENHSVLLCIMAISWFWFLGAAYRLIALYGWDDLIFTHISLRIPGDEHHFLINPYGMMFEEITASSLVRIDQEGNKVNPDDFDINPAGFTIHSAIHAIREDAACVMHTHTTAGVAVSAQKEGLLPLSQQSLFPLSGLAYHDYEGVALREDEKARLQADLGNARFMILRNHGLLTTGPSVAEAFLGMYILQRACEVQIQAMSGGQPLVQIPDSILSSIREQAKQVTKGMGGNLAWPGLLRKLDRIDPGFRD